MGERKHHKGRKPDWCFSNPEPPIRRRSVYRLLCAVRPFFFLCVFSLYPVARRHGRRLASDISFRVHFELLFFLQILQIFPLGFIIVLIYFISIIFSLLILLLYIIFNIKYQRILRWRAACSSSITINFNPTFFIFYMFTYNN